MKVLFLTLYPEQVASARYRVHQFLPYLKAHGVETEVRCAIPRRLYPFLTGPRRLLPSSVYQMIEFPRRYAQMQDLAAYDIVVVQKALSTIYMEGMLSPLKSARRIVLDIDDAVHIRSPHPPGRRWRKREQPDQLRALMQEADCVLAGNRWLCDEVDRAGGRAEWFPTVVDTERFVPPEEPSREFVVGWIGGPSTTPALQVVAQALEQAEPDAIRLVGADRDVVNIEGADFCAWSFQDEVEQVQGFSVGLMPLQETEWDRGKCALKSLQYMACGVPCVATPFGAVCDIMEDGVHGLFARDNEEWARAIDRLRDESERARMSAAGRAHVVEHYSLAVAAPKLLALLESIA